MKLYKIHYTGKDFDVGSSKGYEFASSRREAEKLATTHPDNFDTEITSIEVELNKRGILKALNVHAGHPDNG